MTVSAASLAPRGIPSPIVVAVAAAWAASVAAEASGVAGSVHHDSLLEGGPAFGLALVLFVMAWQVMIAAMMLPSSLPLVRLFWATSGSRRSLAAFLGGYAAVWSVFGAAAFAGDVVLHELFHLVDPLEQRPWLVPGAVLAGAGAFQFTALKDRCLEQCRNPAMFLVRRYRRGAREAFRLGGDHGLFCLGCCWALMLLMFAAGVANLVWMAALAAVMFYEKAGRHGRAATPVVGVALLVWAAVVLWHPDWLPGALGGI